MKTYGVFNRNTFDKTGTIKVTRKFATREEARWYKRENGFKHGIVNLTTGMVVR